MNENSRYHATVWLLLTICTACIGEAQEVKNDPLVRMPGTQPDQGIQLEAPNRCLNCHADYDPAAEPGFNWQGSMMAHSARDFLFWSCLTVAAQDAQWAVGSPNATDICLRCHFPKGWLEGRSDPTNGALMSGADYDGVQCDFCHRMWDPFSELTHSGAGESNDWLGYWDETNASSTPSQPEADITYQQDATLATSIQLFNGEGFFLDNLPKYPQYSENASGQYFVSSSGEKRASFADAAARHKMLYSRYHKSKYFCATCHDVSNPILANLGSDPNAGLPSEKQSAHSYLHVERTFSEFMLSDYGAPGGAAGIGPFANFHITKCQDCHMRDVVGVACNKNGVPIRPFESVEHPQSGQPLHDLTGGNAWVSWVLASTVPESPNYVLENDLLLNQGPAALTLDLTQGQGVVPNTLLAGADRALQQLLLAASIDGLSYNSVNGTLSFRVQNQTGHKLISGFPEGRRMFVNVKVYAGGAIVHQVNPYDETAGTLKGLAGYIYDTVSLPSPQPLTPLDTAGRGEVYRDDLVYEMHPSSTLTGEDKKTFHFALADGRYKDNRIPPLGFRIGEAGARLCVPVWHGEETPGHYNSEEYAGGYDQVTLTIPTGADGVEVNLYYQTTSREYIEFLRNEINGTGNLTLPESGYVAQSDPFFTQLRAWGDTIWNLWMSNKDVVGAKPVLMTQSSWGIIGACQPPVPVLSATPGHQQVTLSWETPADDNVIGYRVYYDQADKSQLIAEVNKDTTTYTDSGLTNGVECFYKVTSRYAACESDFSNVVSAIPTNQGQATDPAGVIFLETGIYSGKGNARTFIPQTDFNAGDDVVILAYIVDQATGLAIPDATVNLLFSGPESFTLTSGPSDAEGVAEVVWQTKSAGRKNPGTLPGDYLIQTKGVTVTGYHWDGVTTSTSITVQ